MNSTSKNVYSSPVLLDCTLRDGGYYNNWDFKLDLIKDYLEAMDAISVDFVEIGFRAFGVDGYKGAAAYATDSWIRSLCAPESLKIGVMVNASELLSYPEGPLSAVAALFKPAIQSPVTLVRIACHLHEFADSLPCCEWLKSQGYIVGINLMQIADRTVEEVENIGKLASDFSIDVLYFADSMGGMDPEGVFKTINALRVHWDGELGIHAHDNMGQALSNSLTALSNGATWIDSTVTGMGRGPGNVKTEYMVITAGDRKGVKPSSVAPLLSVIKKHFEPFQKSAGWGANPYYYLSGKYGIHPTYIQEMLGDSRYEPEDILAVIDQLRVSGGKKFDANALESARHFYGKATKGNWRPDIEIRGREVLILGSGPGVIDHKVAIADYIKSRAPYVIGLNAHTVIDSMMINVRAACHPIRLLADCRHYSNFSQRLITPASTLPLNILKALDGVDLLDYPLSIEKGKYAFSDSSCILPTSHVISYALAVATGGKASRVLLAGFDGYGAGDPRTLEVNELFKCYQETAGALDLLSITPTCYGVPIRSVYAMIAND